MRSSPVVLLILLIGCKNDLITEPPIEFGIPFTIQSLIEITPTGEVDRTNDLPACRLDDLYFFNGALSAIKINGSERQCEGDSVTTIDGNWDRRDTQNLTGQLVVFSLSDNYILHDSLPIGSTVSGFNQGYEIIQLTEQTFVLQSHPNFSTPITENRWQLTWSR